MTVSCAIFDCDGTLVDSERLAMSLLVEMAAERGVRLSLPETTHEFAGVRLHIVVERLQSRSGVTLPEHFIEDYRRRLRARLSSELQAMPHIHDALENLNLPLCIASNAPLDKIQLCLSSTGLAPFFGDRIYSAYEIGSWKPEPGLFLAAARGMGYPPWECVVIEDSLPGLRAARDAGMQVIAYRRNDTSSSGSLSIQSHGELLGAIAQLDLKQSTR
ncbi:MAG: HAD-IA family hydrolase [Pseudomonadota bacterium]